MDDEKMVSEAFERLLQTYLSSPHRKKADLIERAFNFAKQAHKGVRRLSGEPYIMHPVAVAQIACQEIGLGSTSICAALLHDVVEDTDYTVEDISNIFGPKIAQIVDGVTKISGGIFGDKASAQAESFRKLLITMSDDIRVILVKLSDRLHNMRTLGSQRPSKQYKIAGETLYLYAPLAHRLGLNKIKEELEDLSFHYEHPEIRQDIIDKLGEQREEHERLFNEFTAPICSALDTMGIKYDIKARLKTPYSIFNKMQTKHCTFEEVYDILATRIVFEPTSYEEEIADCFRIYAKLIQTYQPHPERFRDWLSHPKANGYQALHVTLMSHFGQWFEVQIRSQRMDEMAEQGFAAHWKYKEGTKTASDSENELEHWLSTIKEILDDPQPNAMDFLDTIKLNLYANEIFVVTPKGEFKTMPADCTVLDFAYSLHSFLGAHCIGAKVNHVLQNMSYKLQSGDQVEILTSKTQRPKREWLEWVYTGKAKSKIEAALRRLSREKVLEGEQILSDFFKKADVESSSVIVDRLCTLHNVRLRETLLSLIGEGQIKLGDEDLAVIQGKKEGNWRNRILGIFNKKEEHKGEELVIDKKKNLVITDDILNRVQIADCCHPIPGDLVLGYVNKDGEVHIHKRNCQEATRLKAADGNSIIAVSWHLQGHYHFPATIRVRGIDHVGVLAELCTGLSKEDVNIHHLNVKAENGTYELVTELEVHNAQDLKQIIKQIHHIEGIQDVKRIS